MKVKFLIAEEIRPEANGKLAILGLFPDDKIMLLNSETHSDCLSEDTQNGIEKLFFLINVSALPEKKYKFRAKIVDPSGEQYRSDIELGEVFVKNGSSHTLVIKIQPFEVKVFGTYTCIFYVNKRTLTFPFEILSKKNNEEEVEPM